MLGFTIRYSRKVLAPPALVGTLPALAFPLAEGTRSFDASAWFTGTGLTYLIVPADANATIDGATGIVTVDTARLASPRSVTIRASNAAGSAEGATLLSVYPVGIDNWIVEETFVVS